ncbi:protein cordon-bleu-like [Paralichthys olivaceus]|uniref:protein cordon-bleu-like n=1 Tax=Paralichthys olivaceus TaxID=8255 RepID=UPI0037503123
MDEEVNPLERDHSLSVVLPGGLEKNATVHGSKPVMDLLVTLCASYHLNPSDYTVEVLSPNKNNISFKPNSPIGSLEAEKIVLKPRGAEEKIRRPYMPEATVRLLINYNKAHKAVVRVNPRVPLELLLPLVCDKCEFQVDTTVLLRDSQSKEPLDMTKSLNEHGLREVFAKDSAGKEPADHRLRPKTPEAEIISPPSLQELPTKESRQKENAGFLSLFRRKKKNPEMDGAASAPASPGANKPMAASMDVKDASSSNTADMPKKRRAPQPPMGGSLSLPNNLSMCHLRAPQSSADSTLRRTKRRAPPPPCANSHQEQQADTQLTGPVVPLNTLEELQESDESVPSLSSSPNPSQTRPSSSSSRPSFERRLPSFGGKDFSDARSTLAKVLPSSVSKGTLIKHLRNAANLPKLHGSSSFRTQRFPDHGVFCMELESVLKSRLPTEPEWEDPLQRKGMTTFKVVPLNKQKSLEPETPLDVPDQRQVTVESDPQSEDPPEESDVPDSPPPAHEPSDAPDSPSWGPSDAPVSPPPAQEAPDTPDSPPPAQEASDAPDSPPPAQEAFNAPDSPPPAPEAPSAPDSPPPAPEAPNAPDSPPPAQEAPDAPDSPPSAQDSDDQDRTVSPLSEVEGNDEGAMEKEEGEPESLSEVTAAAESEKLTSDGQINADDESEDLKSPGRRSVSTDMDQWGSCTDETAEDVFPPPPPPVFFNEDLEVLEDGQEDTTFSPSQPSSPVYNEEFSEDHRDDQDAPEPLDKMSTAPSRFAQAVALAVQRSHLQSHRKAFDPQDASGRHTALPSAPRSTYQYGA